MISTSVPLMTLVDVAIVALGVYAAITLYRYREPVAALGVMRSALMMLAGIMVVAAIYVADLVTMHVLPLFVGRERAMQAMETLFRVWSWWAVLAGVAAMVAGLVLLMRDLLPRTATAMRRMERLNEELSSRGVELERRISAIAGAVPVGVVIARHDDGQLLFANEMWYAMFRVEPGDLGHSARDFYADPEDRSALLREMEYGGTVGPRRVRSRRADGSKPWMLISSTEITFEGDRAILSGMLDVTEQSGTEQRLRDSESRFRAIAEATPYPLFIARRSDGRLLYANDKVREKMGFTDSPLEHHSVEMYWDPSDREPLLDALEHDGRRGATEIRHRTASGEMFWAITSSVALEFDGEDAVLTSFVDISDRKAVEAELATHRDRLEELVEERARALREAQDELLRKERLAAVGQVTATVGHELRNPLGSIFASFEVLRPNIDMSDPRAVRALERIERNVQRCSRIIDELLDYTRSRPLALEPLDLDEWLGDLVHELGDAEGLELVTALGSGAQPLVDRDRLRQAVLNILENALQSMGEGTRATGRLTLTSRLAGERVEIEVTDTGPGIDADDMENIFEPLFSTRSFGVGLGLPLVKEIMRAHRGGIIVTSEAGVGTTVLLWLPLTSAASHEPALRARAAKSSAVVTEVIPEVTHAASSAGSGRRPT